jgi:hypothetical protein
LCISWPLFVLVISFAFGTSLGEFLLCLFLRGVGDVTEVRWSVSWQFAFSDHWRDLRAPGSVCRQNYKGERTQRHGGADLVEAAVRINPFQVRIEGQALAYVAFHQDPLDRPLDQSPNRNLVP